MEKIARNKKEIIVGLIKKIREVSRGVSKNLTQRRQRQ